MHKIVVKLLLEGIRTIALMDTIPNVHLYVNIVTSICLIKTSYKGAFNEINFLRNVCHL